MKKITYVVGLMFSADHSQVALIRKSKPEWQAGKLNGIGGKVDLGEDAPAAMVREFLEESGVETTPHQWRHFLELNGGEKFQVDCFVTSGDLLALKSTEEEQIEISFTAALHPLRQDVVENLPWIVGLAIDHLSDRRPNFVIANYH